MGAETVMAAARALDGVLAGMFVCASMMEHAARVLDAPRWIAYKQAKEAVFGPAMPVIFGVVLLVTVAAAILVPNAGSVASAASLGIALGITVRVHVPLNRLFQSWSETRFPADWDRQRRRWRSWNLVRSALAILAFAAALGS